MPCTLWYACDDKHAYQIWKIWNIDSVTAMPDGEEEMLGLCYFALMHADRLTHALLGSMYRLPMHMVHPVRIGC